MTMPYLHDLAQDSGQAPHICVGLTPAVATPTRIQKVSDSLQLLLGSGCLLPLPCAPHVQQSLGKEKNDK